MITVHSGWATDFSSLGLCSLTPVECTVEEQAGGMFQLKMTHPMDKGGKWWHLTKWNIIKAPAPMRETPLLSMSAAGESVKRQIYSVDVSSRLRLRTKPSTSSGKIIGSYRSGTKVIKIGEDGSWFQVVLKEGGETGWMYADYLEYVGEETQTPSQSDKPPEVVQPRQTRDQLFRIMTVDKDDANALVYITAVHVFYDLTGVTISGGYAPEGVAADQAVRDIFAKAIKPHGFDVYTDAAGEITGEYSGRSIVSALTETDGIVRAASARLIRDNFDVFVLRDEVRDKGVEIRHGKNLLGAVLTEDVSDVIATVVPVGKNKDGDPLYLSGITYIDADDAAQLPVVRAKEISYDVKSGSDDFPDDAAARAEMRRLAELEFTQNGINHSAVGLDVDFVQLENTRQYARYAALQTVHLYDTVRVIAARSGIDAKARVTGYVYNCLTRRYDSMILGDLFALETSVNGYDIAEGSISGNRLVMGSVDGDRIRSLSIGYAKIAQAAIKQLNAEAITATRAHINELVAGNITTDQLYADLAFIAAAQITAANIEKANINWAEIATLTAQIAAIAKAQITTATIKEANISWAEIDTLNAQIASIAQAKIENIEINSADIADLEATVAKIFSANINSADIGFAQIKDLVTNQAIITQGVGGQLYIARLAVTEANMVSLSVGELMIKGDDGRFYALGVDDEGNVTTTVKLVVNDDVADNTIHGTDKLIEGSITAQVLNVQNIFGDSAIIRQLIADNLDVARLFAREATIAALNAVDIRGNKYLQLSVGSKSTVYRSELPPSEANPSDLWIRPSSGLTYQLADDSEELPEFYIDDDGILHYTYGENQTEYKLYIDDEGYLYIDSAAPFAVAINEDGTLCWWQRVKDSELDAAARDALEQAQAAQAAANQNAIDMAGIVTKLNADISDLQNQIDGNITSWFINGTPTADNYPANEWTTDELKSIHLGDLCYDEDTGYCYRWQIANGAYGWTRIADTDVTKALSDAAKAQDTADDKRRVFVSQPTPPYDVGDIWVQGSGGDILRCQYAKTAEQSYAAADWVLASKYTDDTAANAAMNKANANAETIAEHSSQIKLLDDQINLRVTKTVYEQTTSDLRGEIGSAQSAANNAGTAASNAQSAADKAQSTAESAASAAGNAQTAADKAQSDAEAAQSTADSNKTVIERHESEIKLLSDEISLRVTETKFSETTTSLRSEISSASTAASNAQSTADSANAAASKAQTTADSASSAASNAQTTADSASAAAGKAQSTADSASNAASAAQSAADEAQTSADSANAAAGEAQSAADNAQSTADGAASAAANAQTAADNAQNAADEAQTAADNAQSTANDALNKAAANTTIISRHETEIKQLSDQIDLRVTTSVYEQTTSDLRSEINGASAAASDAQNTADSAKSDAAAAQSSANAAATTASNAQSTANAASNAASNAQSTANTANAAATNAQSAADKAQDTADSNTKLLVEQQAQITLLDNQISSKVSRTELEEVQAEAASKSVIHYGDNPPADAGPNDIFVQNGTGIKYKPYAGEGLLPEFYLDDDGYLYYSYDAGQTVYNLMVDDDGRLCIEGDLPFAILIGEDGVPVIWEKITDSELESAIADNKANLENLSNETDERINTAYSEMSQRIDEFEFVIAEKVGREEQRAYMRFDSDGVLELGKQGDRYATQTSNSGFAVLQDGAAMATIERNTVSAPVIEARRQFALGGFAIRLGANGELLIM